jgi:putative salt-induced outer membrane protein YdiY
MRKKILISTLLVAAGTAFAAEETPQSPWGGSAELGFIDTSGNTDTRSTNGAFELKHIGKNWDKFLKLSALTSEEENVTSKEKYNAAIKLDRNFSEHSYLAIDATQERDRFSGFDYQSVFSVGYGYRVIKEEKMNLSLEAAPGYRRDKLKESGDVNEDSILHLAANFDWEISEGVSFIEEFTADIGEDNSTYKSETGLKSKIIGALATKITYKVKYVEEVPDENENTDRELGIAFVYSF